MEYLKLLFRIITKILLIMPRMLLQRFKAEFWWFQTLCRMGLMNTQINSKSLIDPGQ